MDTKKYKIKSLYKKILLGLSILFFLILFIQYGSSVYQKGYSFVVELFTQEKVIRVGDTMVRVEVADTYDKRIQGLSGKESLSKGTGMLFVFEKPDLYGIWMKDMNFDIDILWVNEFDQIIYIVEQATPDSYPETFLPPTPSKYILEVPTSFVKENNIKVGDRVDF